MSSMNLYEPRSGAFLLCTCGHVKLFHFEHSRWYGGPMKEGQPCVYCSCEGFHEAEPEKQAYNFRQEKCHG